MLGADAFGPRDTIILGDGRLSCQAQGGRPITASSLSTLVSSETNTPTDALLTRIEALTAHVERLARRVAALEAENALLKAENAALQEKDPAAEDAG